MPDLADVYRAERGFLARAVRFALQDKKISRFLFLGDMFPEGNPVVDGVAEDGSEAMVVGAVDDEVVKAYWLTHAVLHPEVRAADGTFRLPDTVLRDEATQGLLESGDRVCLVLSGMLDEIEDTVRATAIVRSYLDQLPSESLVIVTHASVDDIDPSQPDDLVLEQQMTRVCRRFASAHQPLEDGHRPPCVLRSADEVGRILGGRVELLEPIGPAVEWNNPGRVPGSRAESLCLGAVAQLRPRNGSGQGASGAVS